jgi:hypothetical protein
MLMQLKLTHPFKPFGLSFKSSSEVKQFQVGRLIRCDFTSLYRVIPESNIILNKYIINLHSNFLYELYPFHTYEITVNENLLNLK